MAKFRPAEPGTPYARITADSGNEALLSVDRDEIEDTYKQFGAILFRGFEPNVEKFATFARSFCSAAALNLGSNRDMLNERHQVQSVDLGGDWFPLHPELSREPWKPDVCFFSSLKPRFAGGETTICDGVQVVRDMPPELFDSLVDRRLLYEKTLTAAEARFWLKRDAPTIDDLDHPPPDCPFAFRVRDGRVIRYFTRPFLHYPMFVDERAFGNFLFFARYFHNNTTFPRFENGETVPDDTVDHIQRICDAITCAHVWEPGDILMLDNTRFMHGRNEVTDPDGRTIATYFGYLKFAVPSDEDPPNAIWRRPDACLPFT